MDVLNLAELLLSADEKNQSIIQRILFLETNERNLYGLKAALSAAPEQYPALREEYRQYALLPEEYAAKLLAF